MLFQICFADVAASCSVQDVAPSIPVHDCENVVDLSDIQDDSFSSDRVHDVLDLLTYVDSAGVQNFVGTDVDSSVDNMVGGTADKVNGLFGDVLCDP